MNPELLAELATRYPLVDAAPGNLDAVRALAAQVRGLAGGDSEHTFTGGVAAVLAWLADGETTSQSLAVVITATDAPQ